MFILPQLPYAPDALAPTMSETTFSFHYGKHHKRYVDVTNQMVAEKNLTGTMEELVAQAKASGDKKLFNNTAQSWNHGFFWECMSPNPTQPSAELKAAIEAAFGDIAGFRSKFIPEGVNHFASGWAWLIAKADGSLEVISTHDADTALMAPGATPILTCDVWEHAYYIDFKNDRQAFLDAWFDKLLNWDFASKQYAAAKAGQPGWRYPAPQ
jgi:Fe-Mn family superoxide dismutase